MSEPSLRADGGIVELENSTANKRPGDCDCWSPEQGVPCWPCYRDDFETPNPEAEDNE